jgi:hypothetical protein
VPLSHLESEQLRQVSSYCLTVHLGKGDQTTGGLTSGTLGNFLPLLGLCLAHLQVEELSLTSTQLTQLQILQVLRLC